MEMIPIPSRETFDDLNFMFAIERQELLEDGKCVDYDREACTAQFRMEREFSDKYG